MRSCATAVVGALVVISSIAAWSQTETASVPPCTPVQQEQARAGPPPAVQPVKPEESGPQLPPPYQRLKIKEKFKVFVAHTYSPYTLAGVAWDAGMSQANGGWRSYGGGMEGYGKRFGASLADNESGVLFGRLLFPLLLHEDPRYIRSISHGFLPRAEYAVSRTFVTRRDTGVMGPNLSLILGAFASSALANAYYPRADRGLGDTVGRAGGALETTAAMNLLREFWPDIKNKIHQRGPKSLRKLEQDPRVQKVEEMMLGPTAPPPCPAASPDLLSAP